MNENIQTERAAVWAPPAAQRRVSWGAIFAGFLVTIVLQLTLTLLGASIGAAAIDPLQEQNPAQGLAVGAAIWLLASGLISLFAGACVAGRLSGGPRRADGLLHGVVTWSLAEIAMVLLLTTAAGTILGGTASLLGRAMSRTGGQPQQDTMTAAQQQLQRVFPQAGALLPPTGREAAQTPGQLTALAKDDPQLAAALARFETQNAPAQRDEVINLLTSKHGMDQAQAANLLTQWDQNLRQTQAQAGQKAREVGDVAARGVSQGALWGFIAMVLGLAVAAWGGWVGTGSIDRYREAVTTTPVT